MPHLDAAGVRRYLRIEDGALLTLPEVAERLRVSRWQVYQLINAGTLRSVKIGRRRLVAQVDLRSYVSRLRGGRDDIGASA